jgi:HK97 gp10 family phage protein
MSDVVKVEITGLNELNRRLKALGPFIASKVLGGAVNAGAQVIRKDAQSRTPVDTGMLQKSLFVKRLTAKDFPNAQYIVGVRKGKKKEGAFYWRFVEFGTKSMGARPFLRPAFEAKKNDAAETIKSRLREGIAKENHK